MAADTDSIGPAIDQVADAIVITDAQGSILYVNAAFTAMTGYTFLEVVGRNPRMLKSGGQDPAYYRDLWKTIQSGSTWQGGLVNRRKDGSTYTEEMTITPVRDSRGKIVRHIAIKRDITERLAAEATQKFLAAILDSSDDAIIGKTLDGRIESWNRGAESLFGYSAHEVIGKDASILVPPDGDAATPPVAVVTTKDGRQIDVSLSGFPIKNAAGEVVGSATVARDVSERRRAQQRLRESEAKYRAIFEASRDALVVADAQNGMLLDANPAALALLGRSIQQVRGLHQAEVHAEEDVSAGRASFQRSRHASGVQEHVVLRPDGRRVPVEIAGSPMRDANGRELILGIFHDLTERRHAEAELRESDARFRIMADGCPTLVWVTDAEGGIRFVNRMYREFFGATYEQVEGAKWQPLIHPDDAPAYLASFLRAVQENTAFVGEVRVRRADGAWRWVTSNAEPRFSISSEFLGHVGVSTDVTENKLAEQALRGSEEKFRQLAENIREVFWMMNAAGTEILYISPGYTQIWGRTCEELYREPMSWLESIEPDDREQAHAVFLKQMEGEDLESEYRIRTPAGELKWVRDRAFPVRDQAGQIIRVVGIAEDISPRKQAEIELAHQARHDHLTGLPNRLLLADGLEASLERAAESGLVTAVIYVDLDGFKFVNDTLGHEAGDALLQQATLRLQGCIREPDMLARMGGDEFMVVVNDVHNDQIAQSIADRLRHALRESFHISDHQLYLTASLGIAMYPRDGMDVSTLRGNADAAMYEAKRNGKDRVLFFTPAMRLRLQERLELDTELRRALEENQLSLNYQPIFDAEGGELTAFEALLRWNHPVLGSISPAKFIPLAEESGLIISIGAWVLEEACRQCRAWQNGGWEGVRVSVNVSTVEFALAEFAAGVERVLDQTGLPGLLLDLELTETAVMRDMDGAIQRMQHLRRRGIRISIDDFGTGYSSLGYLPRLPVDALKIDRSFVAELGTNQTAVSLIQGMISLAHSIGKRVVVEGVETREQLELLKNLGADQVQGFLLGRPAPLSERALPLRRLPAIEPAVVDRPAPVGA